ncbi:hypothetical protein SCG7109_AB_00010, partial [Chlamydiales bacterium SCGC AG-110-M15]
MQKDRYTEEDVQSILQSLFVEKKRVKALQGKIQSIGEERNQLRENVQALENRPKQKISSSDDKKLQAEKLNLEKLKAAAEKKNQNLEGKLTLLQSTLNQQTAELEQAKRVVQKRRTEERDLEAELESEKKARNRLVDALKKHKELNERNKK